MRRIVTRSLTAPFAVVALTAAAWMAPTPALAQRCGDGGVALQVLGSGGPMPSARASTGYLLWRGGRAVALFDAGGGVFLRFGQAGARMEDLRLLAISHLHPDHTSDLPALLWQTAFRTEPLPLIGPSGAALYPPVDVFVERLLGTTAGAWPMLSGASAPVQARAVAAVAGEPGVVFDADGLRVLAMGVPHGTAPTLAFRIEVDDRVVVLGGDQTLSDPAFVGFARNADLLVLHLALSPAAAPPSPLLALHATPEAVGKAAEASGARGLVLSHVVEPRAGDPAAAVFSSADRDTLVASAQAVRRSYLGQITVAEDLQCIVLQ